MRNEEIQMPFYHVIMDIWPALKTDLVSVQQSEEYWEKVMTKYGQLRRYKEALRICEEMGIEV